MKLHRGSAILRTVQPWRKKPWQNTPWTPHRGTWLRVVTREQLCRVEMEAKPLGVVGLTESAVLLLVVSRSIPIVPQSPISTCNPPHCLYQTIPCVRRHHSWSWPRRLTVLPTQTYKSMNPPRLRRFSHSRGKWSISCIHLTSDSHFFDSQWGPKTKTILGRGALQADNFRSVPYIKSESSSCVAARPVEITLERGPERWRPLSLWSISTSANGLSSRLCSLSVSGYS